MKSQVGRALGGTLKNVARLALPAAGAALGSFVAPGVGTALGGKLGSAASNLFELEFEGMDREQAELGGAALCALCHRGRAQRRNGRPEPPAVGAGNAAVAAAARATAPGLVPRRAPPPQRRGGRPRPGRTATAAPSYAVQQGGYGDGDGDDYGSSGRQSGRWVRRGRKVVPVRALIPHTTRTRHG